MSLPGTSKRKKAEDKKRKHHHHPHDTGPPDKKKRPKVEGHPPAAEQCGVEASFSESDQLSLDRWKQIQQTTRPFIHPIRKMVGKDGQLEGTGSLMYQEQLLRQQSEQIEQQKHQLEEQQKKIREQEERIQLLQEQKRALLHECQAAGIKIPEIVMTSRLGMYSSTASLATNLPPQAQPPTYAMPPSQQPLSQPPVSPAQPLNQSSPYGNISPAAHPPSHTPHTHRPDMHPSALRTTPPQNLSGISQQHAHSLHPIPLSSAQFVSAPQMQPTATSCGININQTSQLLPTGTLYPPGETAIRTSPLMGNLNFPALTNEFQELAPNEAHGLLPRTYSPPPLNTFDSFPDDLDSILNIAGLPTGSGAGYGVGVMEEELHAPMSNPQLDLRLVRDCVCVCVCVCVCRGGSSTFIYQERMSH